jgi:hypothetical protein
MNDIYIAEEKNACYNESVNIFVILNNRRL